MATFDECKCKPEFKRTLCDGGFNSRGTTGYNGYTRAQYRWGVTYISSFNTRTTVHFKRKKDAQAVFRWITETDWDGEGCLVTAFTQSMSKHSPDVADTFKGEA